AVVELGAGVAVVAGGAVGLRRVRAHAGRGHAAPGRVALVARLAGHRAPAHAHARLAGVDHGAGVAVVAGRAVRLGRAGHRRAVRARGERPRAGADAAAHGAQALVDEAVAVVVEAVAHLGRGESRLVAVQRAGEALRRARAAHAEQPRRARQVAAGV